MSTPEEPFLPDEAQQFANLLGAATLRRLKATNTQAELEFALDDGDTYLAVFIRDPETAEHDPLPPHNVARFFLSLLQQCSFTCSTSERIYTAKILGWKIAADRQEAPKGVAFHDEAIFNVFNVCGADYSALFGQN